MTWTFIWLMVLLKLPIAALLYIVWWAIKQTPETAAGSGDGGLHAPPRPVPRHPRDRRPRPPRRGPHAEPPPASPPRVRAVARVVRRLAP